MWKDGYEVVDFQSRAFQCEVFMRYMWMVAGGSNNSKMVGAVNDECARRTDAPTATYGCWHPGWPPFLHGSTSLWAVTWFLCNNSPITSVLAGHMGEIGQQIIMCGSWLKITFETLNLLICVPPSFFVVFCSPEDNIWKRDHYDSQPFCRFIYEQHYKGNWMSWQL